MRLSDLFCTDIHFVYSSFLDMRWERDKLEGVVHSGIPELALCGLQARAGAGAARTSVLVAVTQGCLTSDGRTPLSSAVELSRARGGPAESCR